MAHKNYLIVGGSKGIGFSLVQKLVEGENQVFVVSKTRGNLPDISNITHIPLDVTADEITFPDFPEKINGVAYCPGSINLKPFRSLKQSDFINDFEINLLGAVKVLQAVEKKLKKAGSASVVLFSTVAVQQGMSFHTSIAAAKGAVEGLTRSLAAEWAPRVRVNCIAPSLTDTPLAERLLSSPEKREAGANRHPLKKIGKPSDLAEIAEFLLSEKSNWITGQIIGVDGGMSALRV